MIAAAEPLGHAFSGLLDRIQIRYVSDESGHTICFRNGWSRILPVDDSDRRAFGQKLLCDCQAQPGGATDDDCDLPFELQIH
jgi:hypothetical protein